MRTLFTVLIIILLGAVCFYLFMVYSGAYSVAAHPEGGGFLAWTLDHTMDHSVARHAAQIKVPPLNDPALIASGAKEYGQACVQCHGAPGKERAEFTKGMDPTPPEFDEIGKEKEPAAIFWVAKNGIQMTGMPEFGTTQSDRTLWGVVALMKRLPKMSPADYQNLMKQAGSSGD